MNQILQYRFTVRDAEKESRKRHKKTVRRQPLDPALESVKEDLRDALATKVEIKKKAGKGQIVINFLSDEEFQEVVDKIIS